MCVVSTTSFEYVSFRSLLKDSSMVMLLSLIPSSTSKISKRTALVFCVGLYGLSGGHSLVNSSSDVNLLTRKLITKLFASANVCMWSVADGKNVILFQKLSFTCLSVKQHVNDHIGMLCLYLSLVREGIR